MAKLPLEGIRVLDITMVWALPWTGAMLGELGAEVIRVEQLQRYPRLTRGIFPKPTREIAEMLGTIGSGFPDGEPGERPWDRFAMFNGIQRSKLSCTMDLERPEGIELFKRLVKVSDGFIENNAPEVMDKLGLTWEALSEVNPRLVYVRAPGYGLSGPYRNYSGLGMIFESVAGHSWTWWYDNDDMSGILPCFHADAAAGASALFALMMGLHHREKTGRGQLVDLGQCENFLPHLGEAFMDYTMNGRIRGTMCNRHPTAVQGVYLCKGAKPSLETPPGEDHWVAITIQTDEEWEGFCRAIGNPDWTKEKRFSDFLSRLKNQDDLDKLIEEWTSQRDKYEVMHTLQREGVPAGAVLNSRDAFNDPHLKERGWPVELTHRECGTHMYPGPVWHMSKTPSRVFQAPCLGEHNEYVYKKVLGVSDEEYERLVKEGHIGDTYIGI